MLRGTANTFTVKGILYIFGSFAKLKIMEDCLISSRLVLRGKLNELIR